jgi:gas vesicle protein
MDDNKGLTYFFIGLGVGVAVGLICAPVSGSEARDLIRTRAGEGGDYIRKRGEDLKGTANEAVQKGRDVLARQKDKLNAAVDAGKQAYTEAVSQVSSATSNSGESLG